MLAGLAGCQSSDFREWMDKTARVNVTPAAQAWYREHAADIRDKKLDYLRCWNAAPTRSSGPS